MILKNVDVETLSAIQRRLADYFIRHQHRIPYLGIEEIAVENLTSTATVSRFIKLLGYANLKDYKNQIRSSMEFTPASKVQASLQSLESEDIMAGVAETEIANLRTAVAELDRREFDAAVQALARASRLVIYGNGSSRCLAELIAFRMNRYGIAVCHAGRDASTMAESLVHLEPGSVVLAFSFFKERASLGRLFAYARSRGSVSILVTDLHVSRTASQADHVLLTNRGELSRFHSMVAPIALVDALTLAVTKELGPAGTRKLDALHACKRILREDS